MGKNHNFIILLSFFCLWINSFFSDKFQIIIGFIFILSFGILHGANDLKLILTLNIKNKSISFYKIITYYIAVVLVGVVCFYTVPLFALILFISVSGYHFGEQQWQNLENRINKRFIYSFQFTYGITILLILFHFHQQEVQNIIFEITSVAISNSYIPLLLKIFGLALISMLLYLYLKVVEIRNQLILEVFYLLIFTIIFISSSLIWGFAIYFVLWHSIPSMIDQIHFLYSDFNFSNFKKYIKSAFIYWIASLFGIALLYFIFKEEKMFNALFFSFLAAITFPHALVILKMFGRKF
ncbi:Brp/Blh family beta-carotene 15,15'-dioxygenase [Flavobacterium sp.]|uniref:Brp/Blh family beta-carotene 15,15'-dioxygenase n=1 Tax=Flavobacterium sp. TaxID=239 RepID=UPI00286E475A|nr:Brp/Blh family beta-carotene 15,15'-dioxygenase [Flavobacterium sp.]